MKEWLTRKLVALIVRVGLAYQLAYRKTLRYFGKRSYFVYTPDKRDLVLKGVISLPVNPREGEVIYELVSGEYLPADIIPQWTTVHFWRKGYITVADHQRGIFLVLHRDDV